MKESLTIDELRGKQSVRTTFKLPKQLIDVLGIAASQLGIKQKSLLDQLIDEIDVSEVKDVCRDGARTETEVRPKTFVLSRNSLNLLNQIAEQQDMPRDAIAEFSIGRLLPLMNEERARHAERKTIQRLFREYYQCGAKLMSEAEKRLGKEDALYEVVEKQLDSLKKHMEIVDKMVEKGRPLEKW